MKQSRCTESQIVIILKKADSGRPVNEIWRKPGISSATYYKWKSKCSGRWQAFFYETTAGASVEKTTMGRDLPFDHDCNRPMPTVR